MWIIYSVVLHIFLLGSIFVIYFRSPVITNLQPQPSILAKAPAKRLVLIVTDGLRAQSFFQDNCANIPHLKEMMLKLPNGVVGISQTRVPTESRPGHIALIAGLYEDPSAVTRGWKENPIEFDTVFNRSRKTWAWGANDILHIFSRLTKDDEKRLFFDSYSHELDFSGKEKTYELDQWVFERVEKLLKRKSQELQEEEQVIFFLHLLGLDTAGHVHKPGSELFLENLLHTEEGIKRTYDLFESTFPDGKTAYVLTSDHGMTDAGSHGAGEEYETETPFFIWGSGISAHPNTTIDKTISFDADNQIPLYRIEQAQMAPLMSALLGIATPMNNFGTLPKDFLNTSIEYRHLAAQNNAYQLAEQYRALLKQHERGWLTVVMPNYSIDIHALKDYIEEQAKLKYFSNALDGSYELMEAALKGIDYYFSYFRWPLLLATTATYVGFLGHLLMILGNFRISTTRVIMPDKTNRGYIILLVSIGFIVSSFCLLQQVEWTVSFYLLLPVMVWYYFLASRDASIKIAFKVEHTLLLVCCSELLVYTFFQRRAISVGFLLFSIYEKINKAAYSGYNLKFYTNLVLSLALAIFPLLPPTVGYSNNVLLYIGILLTALRSIVVKNSLHVKDTIFVFLGLLNAVVCIYMNTHQLGELLVSHVISWAFLLYVLVSCLRPSRTTVKRRMERLIFLLTSLYALLCTSYEPLFLLVLISELITLVGAENKTFTLDDLYTGDTTTTATQISHSFRYAFVMILYTFFSFFGTGNIASVSSFDPNIIRCFLSIFSPYVIMFLVLLKLIIPIIIIMTIIFALSPYALQNEREIFICLLIICDVMGLNFLFLVKNQGSWLEIGSSISHFVIMQVTTVVLAIFVYLSKFLLKLQASQI